MKLEYIEPNKEIQDKFRYSLLLAAVGDAIGWPLEFARKAPKTRIEEFREWPKRVGGKWWGYNDKILKGEYSDDTQLTLAVARSITTEGRFEPTHFAYLELPLWLNYERGSGTAVKTAARNILKKNVTWNKNIYKTKDINYYDAGANGAAMRNLPIALVNINNINQFIEDTIKNTLITHGHPRAFIGSLLIGSMQIFCLREDSINLNKLYNFISNVLKSSYHIYRKNRVSDTLLGYDSRYKDAIDEALMYIKKLEDYLAKDDKEYYILTNALKQEFKGSGISTTAVAIYMFIKYMNDYSEALFRTANMVGSDTDTIASFVGSLIGAYSNSINRKLCDLINQLQDKEYFELVANILWEISRKDIQFTNRLSINKKEMYLKILAWEIGLHEMFWEALNEGDIVVHPILGRGTIKKKIIKDIVGRDDYVVKIFKIDFDVGQSAYFHSRVKKDNYKVSDTFSEEILKYIE